jgi:hypothetical protein
MDAQRLFVTPGGGRSVSVTTICFLKAAPNNQERQFGKTNKNLLAPCAHKGFDLFVGTCFAKKKEKPLWDAA